jgi:hypothetical protein
MDEANFPSFILCFGVNGIGNKQSSEKNKFKTTKS